MPRPKLRTVLASACVVAAVLLAWQRFRSLNDAFGPFLADDALISYRYAERLASGHGLTWNDGERVEGYSNLAWVLMLALYRVLGGDLVVGGRVLGLGCALVTLVALALAFRPRSVREPIATFAGPLVLAISTPFVVWASAGLEQALLGAALALAVALAFEDLDAHAVPRARRHAFGAVAALLCWTRPDGALLAGTILLPWAWLRREADDAWTAPRVVFAWPTAAVLGQLAFRLAYYHELVPNTAKAKLGFTDERLEMGLGYARGATDALLPLLAWGFVAAALALAGAPRTRRLAIVAAPFVAWLAYVVRIGGDIFPAHRHFLPLVVLAAFALSELLRLLASFSWRGVALGLVAIVVLPRMLADLAASDVQAHRAVQERWEWDGQLVGRLLRRAFGARAPLLAVDPAGCVPYFSGLPSIDMLGLNDRFLAAHPPEGFGTGFLGHELGDGDYVLDREPDLVLFCGAPGRVQPCFRSGIEMVADPRFARDYRPVRFETRGVRRFISLLFVRSVGAKLGARREAGRVVVPTYLFTGTMGSAHLEGDAFVAALPMGTHADVPITLPRAGRYRLAYEADRPAAIRLGLPGLDGRLDTRPILAFESTRALLAIRVEGDAVLRRVELIPLD